MTARDHDREDGTTEALCKVESPRLKGDLNAENGALGEQEDAFTGCCGRPSATQ